MQAVGRRFDSGQLHQFIDDFGRARADETALDQRGFDPRRDFDKRVG